MKEELLDFKLFIILKNRLHRNVSWVIKVKENHLLKKTFFHMNKMTIKSTIRLQNLILNAMAHVYKKC